MYVNDFCAKRVKLKREKTGEILIMNVSDLEDLLVKYLNELLVVYVRV